MTEEVGFLYILNQVLKDIRNWREKTENKGKVSSDMMWY